MMWKPFFAGNRYVSCVRSLQCEILYKKYTKFRLEKIISKSSILVV